MKAVFALSVLAAAVSGLSFKTDSFWQSYKTTFGRKYSSDAEEARRYKVFNENMARAAEYNKIDSSAVYGMTPVADRFRDEITMTPVLPERHEITYTPSAVSLPSSYDARNEGLVPAIRDQGQCGSCWAFSAVATMSSNYAKKHGGAPPVLSEQQIVDCSTSDHGCSGGWPINAFEYAKKGVMLASDYPYSATSGTCKFDASKVKTRVVSYGYAPTTVDGMKNSVYSNGMISVAVNADKMQVYSGGIISADGCSTMIDHAVNVVGWGSQGGVEYWIVRNSWGVSWGESGYCRMVAGKNACGIESYPMYALVE